MMTVWSFDCWLEKEELEDVTVLILNIEIKEANSPVKSFLILAWAIQHSDKEQQESCVKTLLLLAYGTDW